MKIKIKPKSFFLDHPKCHKYGSAFEVYEGSTFGTAMNEHCNEVFTVSEKDKLRDSRGYFRYSIEGWAWDDWMFDIIEEVDKKGNFLLEF